MYKILQKLSFFTLILAFATIITLFYWHIRDYQPITFNENDFTIINKTVNQGGYLVYKLDYCKENNLFPHVTRTFVDGIIYSIPQELQPFLEEGCHVKYFQIYIPKALPIGEYILSSTYTFQVNPIRTVDILGKTEKFEVVATH